MLAKCKSKPFPTLIIKFGNPKAVVETCLIYNAVPFVKLHLKDFHMIEIHQFALVTSQKTTDTLCSFAKKDLPNTITHNITCAMNSINSRQSSKSCTN